MNTQIVSSPNIEGNIGSCEIKSNTYSLDSWHNQTVAINSCTGEIVSTQSEVEDLIASFKAHLASEIERAEREMSQKIWEEIEKQRIHGDNSRNWEYVNACDDIKKNIRTLAASKGINLE